MRYYISDLHFFHKGMNERMDCRGFSSIEEMNEVMVDRWNAKVRNGDEVVILGDLSFGKAEETNQLVKRLNGKLYLIEGNHDERFLSDKNFDRSRFEWIRPYAEIHDRKRKVILSHYPIFCYNGQFYRKKDGSPRTYMLYGHVHKTDDERLVQNFAAITRQTLRKQRGYEEPLPIPCQMINCFCMFSDYIPLTLDEWIENDAQRERVSDPSAFPAGPA